jgi:hypothetical protein
VIGPGRRLPPAAGQAGRRLLAPIPGAWPVAEAARAGCDATCRPASARFRSKDRRAPRCQPALEMATGTTPRPLRFRCEPARPAVPGATEVSPRHERPRRSRATGLSRGQPPDSPTYRIHHRVPRMSRAPNPASVEAQTPDVGPERGSAVLASADSTIAAVDSSTERALRVRQGHREVTARDSIGVQVPGETHLRIWPPSAGNWELRTAS